MSSNPFINLKQSKQLSQPRKTKNVDLIANSQLRVHQAL